MDAGHGPGKLTGMIDLTPQALDRVRVGDCMHPGIVSCDPEALLPEVAAVMTSRRVHAVAIPNESGELDAIISDLDVLSAAACAEMFRARDIVPTGTPSTSSGSSLREAAKLMAELGVCHLIVRDQANGHPVGVLSSSDVLSAFGATAHSPA